MTSEPLEIERLDRGVLSLHGPLTMENVSPFLNAVRREDAPTMILDFTGVPYLDSSGLGSLVSACTSCAKAGRRMALTGVNKRVLKVFEITEGRADLPDVPHIVRRTRGLHQRGHGVIKCSPELKGTGGDNRTGCPTRRSPAEPVRRRKISL